MAVTWRLVGAAAAAHGGLDLGRGVQVHREPRGAAASIMTIAEACAVPMTVETLVSAKTRSMATASGWCRANHAAMLVLERDEPPRRAGRSTGCG